MNHEHELDGNATVFGLLACGSSGSWTVDLDESSDGTEWSLTFDGPNVYLAFAPLNLSVVRAARDYLRTTRGEPLALGHFGQVAVRLHRDDEETGRCYLIVGPRAHSTFRATLSVSDATMLADALEQILDDLPPEPHPER